MDVFLDENGEVFLGEDCDVPACESECPDGGEGDAECGDPELPWGSPGCDFDCTGCDGAGGGSIPHQMQVTININAGTNNTVCGVDCQNFNGTYTLDFQPNTVGTSGFGGVGACYWLGSINSACSTIFFGLMYNPNGGVGIVGRMSIGDPFTGAGARLSISLGLPADPGDNCATFNVTTSGSGAVSGCTVFWTGSVTVEAL